MPRGSKNDESLFVQFTIHTTHCTENLHFLQSLHAGMFTKAPGHCALKICLCLGGNSQKKSKSRIKQALLTWFYTVSEVGYDQMCFLRLYRTENEDTNNNSNGSHWFVLKCTRHPKAVCVKERESRVLVYVVRYHLERGCCEKLLQKAPMLRQR